jgi:hypothetical protein
MFGKPRGQGDGHFLRWVQWLQQKYQQFGSDPDFVNREILGLLTVVKWQQYSENFQYRDKGSNIMILRCHRTGPYSKATPNLLLFGGSAFSRQLKG